MEKKKSKSWMYVLVVVIVLALGFFIYTASRPHSRSFSPMTTSTKIKLTDSRYASQAYLISSESLSNETTQALAGFSVNRQVNPDGSLTITLKALSLEYQDQRYTVQPDQKLYFIETSFGDDTDTRDISLGDDHALIVDAEGYIVSSLPA